MNALLIVIEWRLEMRGGLKMYRGSRPPRGIMSRPIEAGRMTITSAKEPE
jgi:hypothetical protein